MAMSKCQILMRDILKHNPQLRYEVDLGKVEKFTIYFNDKHILFIISRKHSKSGCITSNVYFDVRRAVRNRLAAPFIECKHLIGK